MERDFLWRRVVDAKYGSMLGWGCWCSNGVQGTYGICLRKNIRKGLDSFIVLLLLRWGMVPISNSGLILGVGDSFKRCLSRIIRYCQ